MYKIVKTVGHTDFDAYLDAQLMVVFRLASTVNGYRPPDVHQLRTATRRIRAVIWILRFSSVKSKFKKLNHILSRLGCKSGKVRELDVAISDSKVRKFKTEKFRKRRRVARKDLTQYLTDQRVAAIVAELMKMRKVVAQTGKIKFARTLTKIKTDLVRRQSSPLKTQTHLHKLRIAIKKSRYALEAIGLPFRFLKRLQDLLGAAHDVEFLRSGNRNFHDLKMLKQEQSLLNAKAVANAAHSLSCTIRKIDSIKNKDI